MNTPCSFGRCQISNLTLKVKFKSFLKKRFPTDLRIIQMLSCSPNSSIDMDEINKELEKIEGKYTPKMKKCPKISISLHESLGVLSKEFDSLGLSVINVEKTMPEILEQVVKNSRDLVQIHRNTVNHIKEKNIEKVTQSFKHQELYVKMDNYKESLEKLQENCVSLKNSKSVLCKEVKELKERELLYKEELKRLKRAYYGKEELLEHNIRKLKLEIERLKKICGKDLVSDSSNEVALKLMKKYKTNEEIYKSTIKTLQENNRELLDEILSLKEETILLRANK